MRTRSVVIVGIVLGVIAGLAAAYPRLWRRRCLTWGVSEQDAAADLPGDELLEGPDVVTTRGVEVDAAPDDVWPWLVQMGSGRAGAYTYDWLENLFGLDMHSADRIVPEFQDLKVGDRLPVGERARSWVSRSSTPAGRSWCARTTATGCGRSCCASTARGPS